MNDGPIFHLNANPAAPAPLVQMGPAACGAGYASRTESEQYVIDNRDAVTCRNCRRSWLFRYGHTDASPANVLDLIERADSVIRESGDADEHAELLAELHACAAALSRQQEPKS